MQNEVNQHLNGLFRNICPVFVGGKCDLTWMILLDFAPRLNKKFA
jgi:hypothetical protein